MDYTTKPVSRALLRNFSLYFRELFDVPQNGAFPVLYALEKLPDVFQDCNFQVVEDTELLPQVMALCLPKEDGGFTIKIKDSVYNAAYNKNGASLGFICHEICHIFLFKIGFTPIYTRNIADDNLPAYCSVEWQAKALCAEVMIPYTESENMKPQEIIDTYNVSKAFANYRRKLRNKNYK